MVFGLGFYMNRGFFKTPPQHKPTIVCSIDNPRLSLSCLTAMSNFATLAFIWKNVIMMDSFEIVAACDLEVG